VLNSTLVFCGYMSSNHPFPAIHDVQGQPNPLSSSLQDADILNQIAEQLLALYEERSLFEINRMNDDDLYAYLNKNCEKLNTIRSLLQLNNQSRTLVLNTPTIKAMLLPVIIHMNTLRHKIPWWDNDAFWAAPSNDTTINEFFRLVELCARLRQQFETRHTQMAPPRLTRSGGDGNPTFSGLLDSM
jgi:hypothetical protein